MIEKSFYKYYILYITTKNIKTIAIMKSINLHIGSMISPMGIGLGQHLPEKLRNVL